MAAHVSELDEALATVLALVGLHLVVNVEVVDQVGDLVEVGLTVVELAEHDLLHSVGGRVDPFDAVVLGERLQLQDLEILVVGLVLGQKVLVLAL